MIYNRQTATDTSPSEAPDSLLTVQDVMKRLNVSRTTVWGLTKDGLLPGFKLGKAVRYRREDVENVLTPIPTKPREKKRSRKTSKTVSQNYE